MKPLHVAFILAILSAVGAWQVTLIPESLKQMTVGPSLVPGVVVAGLSVLAILYGISAVRGRQVDESHAEDQSPLPGASTRLLSLLGGGLAFIALIGPLGFARLGDLGGDRDVGVLRLVLVGDLRLPVWRPQPLPDA